MRLLINTCWGGFSFSSEACQALDCNPYDYREYEHRSDEAALALFDKIGSERMSGAHATIVCVEIPDGISFYIEDIDGVESVHETHRIWKA